ncbi:hypothetical protein F8388_008954 [Cannabis sativa]|uniref:Protein ApaG n=1 Tax=Cannabis sativa TaxID=3483 RepID=A0A7J6DTW1_CANSA|nr:hypothetical protein F8388_008954 [Cannabis sativa]
MHSLSLKVFADFNGKVTAARCMPSGRGRYGVSGLDFRTRRFVYGSGDSNWRSCRITASSSERDANNGGGRSRSSSSSSNSSTDSSSFLSRSQTYALLKQKMEVAAKSEDYEEAARIRDSLKLFEEEEPVLRLRRLIKEAVVDERFEVKRLLVLKSLSFVDEKFRRGLRRIRRIEIVAKLFCCCPSFFLLVLDAANYRDELREIAPHSLLKCSSDATTLGIRVQVRSVYIEGRSQPSKGRYFFAYRIRITNNSERPVQLLRRHWIITDAHGKTENVWGTGVIGEQPVILPQTSFEYSSACPLCTANGRMEGDFEMKHIDKTGSQSFNVAIAPFSLSILGDDDDSF